MTDEEMADEYASNHGDDNVLDFGDFQINLWPLRRWSFLDGLEAGKPKWHDLRKSPDDLPKGEGLFVVYWSLGKIDGYTVINGFKNPHKDIVAWCEIPEFKEV